MIDLTTRTSGCSCAPRSSPRPVRSRASRPPAPSSTQAGVGAVVLPSLFQEQIEHETSEIDRLFSIHAPQLRRGQPVLPRDRRLQHRQRRPPGLIEASPRRVDVPVIASLNGTQHRRMAALRPPARRRRRRRHGAQPLRDRGPTPPVSGRDRSRATRLVALCAEASTSRSRSRSRRSTPRSPHFARRLDDAGAAGSSCSTASTRPTSTSTRSTSNPSLAEHPRRAAPAAALDRHPACHLSTPTSPPPPASTPAATQPSCCSPAPTSR